MKSNGDIKDKRNYLFEDSESFWDDVSFKSTMKNNLKHQNNKGSKDEDLSQTITTPQFRSNEKTYTYNKPIVSQKDISHKKINPTYDDYITFENQNENKRTTSSTLKSKNNSKGFEQDVFMNQKRAEKFNYFLNKYSQHPRNNAKHNNRFENLYVHAKMKHVYLEKVRKKAINDKKKDEDKECTFIPSMNKRSRSMANDIIKKGNIYQRSVQWDKNRNAKIVQDKRLNMLNIKEYSFQPQLTEYHLPNPDKDIRNNLDTALYIERQEKARLRKSTSELKTKYKSCSSEPSQCNKTNISQSYLYEYKATLHDELIQGCSNDGY